MNTITLARRKLSPFDRCPAKRMAEALCILLCLACGCAKHDPNRAAIHGRVTLDGQPLAHGAIAFIPIQGTRGPAAGMQIVDGQYDISAANGAAIGSNRVEIRSLKKTGKQIERPDSSSHEMIDEEVEAVAATFNSDSTLTFDVKPGNNTADFDVASQ